MKLVAAYAFKYEPDWLIDQLRENLSFVDEFVTYDTRDVDQLWIPRRERAAVLFERAVQAGADWVLSLDPDERLEDGGQRAVARLISAGENVAYRLRCRELWTPTAYRIDGIWGRKTRLRLFHLRSRRAGLPRRPTLVDLNLYHLKMIEPKNRAMRRDVFKHSNWWDNRHLGFDYLTDETGCQLQDIPPGRGYNPPYRPYRFEVPSRYLDNGRA